MVIVDFGLIKKGVISHILPWQLGEPEQMPTTPLI